jgi:acyl-CoA synthetase (AMP-forming)/AMP-acid ligase II
VILVDPTGERLTEGRVGEIWVRGPVVAAGYWGRPDATQETFGAIAADGSGPWLRTGDLGALHEGSLVVTGRLKELLIIHGRNVFPYDLERLMQTVHPGAEGRPGAVFTPSERPGTVVAVQEFRATLRPTDPVTQAEALTELDSVVHEMAALLADVSGAQVTDVVLVRPGRVQRTTSGKIQRGRTREALESGALEPLHSLRVARRSPDPRHDHAGATA